MNRRTKHMPDRQGISIGTQYKILSISVILSMTITLGQYYTISPDTATTIIGMAAGGSMIISASLFFTYVFYDTFIDNLINDQSNKSQNSGTTIQESPEVVEESASIQEDDLNLNVDRELLNRQIEHNGFDVSVAAKLTHSTYNSIDPDVLFRKPKIPADELSSNRYYRVVDVVATDNNNNNEQQQIGVSTALPLGTEDHSQQSDMDVVDQVDKSVKSVIDEIDTINQYGKQTNSNIDFLIEQVEKDVSETNESEIDKALSNDEPN